MDPDKPRTESEIFRDSIDVFPKYGITLGQVTKRDGTPAIADNSADSSKSKPKKKPQSVMVHIFFRGGYLYAPDFRVEGVNIEYKVGVKMKISVEHVEEIFVSQWTTGEAEDPKVTKLRNPYFWDKTLLGRGPTHE